MESCNDLEDKPHVQLPPSPLLEAAESSPV